MNTVLLIVAFVLAVSFVAFLIMRKGKNKNIFVKQFHHESIGDKTKPRLDDENEKFY